MKKLIICIVSGLIVFVNIGFCADDDVKNPCINTTNIFYQIKDIEQTID